jgi:hypothetical protein
LQQKKELGGAGIYIRGMFAYYKPLSGEKEEINALDDTCFSY